MASNARSEAASYLNRRSPDGVSNIDYWLNIFNGINENQRQAGNQFVEGIEGRAEDLRGTDARSARDRRRAQVGERTTSDRQGGSAMRAANDRRASAEAKEAARRLSVDVIQGKQKQLLEMEAAGASAIQLEPLQREIRADLALLKELEAEIPVLRNDIGELPDSMGRFRDGTVKSLEDPNADVIGYDQSLLQELNQKEFEDNIAGELRGVDRDVRLGERGRPDLRTPEGIEEFVIKEIAARRDPEKSLDRALTNQTFDPVGFSDLPRDFAAVQRQEEKLEKLNKRGNPGKGRGFDKNRNYVSLMGDEDEAYIRAQNDGVLARQPDRLPRRQAFDESEFRQARMEKERADLGLEGGRPNQPLVGRGSDPIDAILAKLETGELTLDQEIGNGRTVRTLLERLRLDAPASKSQTPQQDRGPAYELREQRRRVAEMREQADARADGRYGDDFVVQEARRRLAQELNNNPNFSQDPSISPAAPGVTVDGVPIQYSNAGARRRSFGKDEAGQAAIARRAVRERFGGEVQGPVNPAQLDGFEQPELTAAQIREAEAEFVRQAQQEAQVRGADEGIGAEARRRRQAVAEGNLAAKAPVGSVAFEGATDLLTGKPFRPGLTFLQDNTGVSIGIGDTAFVPRYGFENQTPIRAEVPSTYYQLPQNPVAKSRGFAFDRPNDTTSIKGIGELGSIKDGKGMNMDALNFGTQPFRPYMAQEAEQAYRFDSNDDLDLRYVDSRGRLLSELYGSPDRAPMEAEVSPEMREAASWIAKMQVNPHEDNGLKIISEYAAANDAQALSGIDISSSIGELTAKLQKKGVEIPKGGLRNVEEMNAAVREYIEKEPNRFDQVTDEYGNKRKVFRNMTMAEAMEKLGFKKGANNTLALAEAFQQIELADATLKEDFVGRERALRDRFGRVSVLGELDKDGNPVYYEDTPAQRAAHPNARPMQKLIKNRTTPADKLRSGATVEELKKLQLKKLQESKAAGKQRENVFKLREDVYQQEANRDSQGNLKLAELGKVRVPRSEADREILKEKRQRLRDELEAQGMTDLREINREVGEQVPPDEIQAAFKQLDPVKRLMAEREAAVAAAPPGMANEVAGPFNLAIAEAQEESWVDDHMRSKYGGNLEGVPIGAQRASGLVLRNVNDPQLQAWAQGNVDATSNPRFQSVLDMYGIDPAFQRAGLNPARPGELMNDIQLTGNSPEELRAARGAGLGNASPFVLPNAIEQQRESIGLQSQFKPQGWTTDFAGPMEIYPPRGKDPGKAPTSKNRLENLQGGSVTINPRTQSTGKMDWPTRPAVDSPEAKRFGYFTGEGLGRPSVGRVDGPRPPLRADFQEASRAQGVATQGTATSAIFGEAKARQGSNNAMATRGQNLPAFDELDPKEQPGRVRPAYEDGYETIENQSANSKVAQEVNKRSKANRAEQIQSFLGRMRDNVMKGAKSKRARRYGPGAAAAGAAGGVYGIYDSIQKEKEKREEEAMLVR